MPIPSRWLKRNWKKRFPNLTTFEAKTVRQTIEKIYTALRDKQIDKKVAQKLNYAKKEWPAKLDKYEQQRKNLKDRGSYSKTDPDATFMRMKEDHMLHWQLKWVTMYRSAQQAVHHPLKYSQKPNDTTTRVPHLEGFKKQYGSLPENITADTGYCGQENYTFLEDNGVKAFV